MAKTRINDLAREMEVKSRVILDALLAVGYTEHKTHSSAVEDEIAEQVRVYLRTGAVPSATAPAAAAPPTVSAPEVAPEAPAAPPTAAPAPARVGTTRGGPAGHAAAGHATTVAPKPGPKLPVAPPRPVYQAPAPAPPTPPTPATPPAASPATRAAAPPPAPGGRGAPLTPPRPLSPPVPAPPVVRPPVSGLRPAPPPPNVLKSPSLTAAPSPLAESSAPGRRVIVPTATQRPVYAAPPPTVKPATPAAAGRPTAGKPIYQRPGVGARPGAPVPGRSITPEGRRPMHPTRPGGGARPSLPGRAPQHGRREPRTREGRVPYQQRPDQMPSGPIPINRTVTLTEGITVKELSERLEVRVKDVIRKLLDRGLMATVNQSLDAEIAIAISREFGAEASVVSYEEQALQEVEQAVAVDSTKRVARPPVVTVMGHVDHGKTSLLDALRETDVAAGEAGGITQHIGAYKVAVVDPNSPAFGREIVFVDTPGHAAFTRMRARGAKVTDIVIIVVAADDGVMPQTIEAIDHAKAANVPIIVAVNKIDKPDAQPDRVKKQLSDLGLTPEAWGGQTVTVDVSARAKTNLNLLLEMILLVADLQDLKADPDGVGQGTVIEAELDRGRGPVARILVQGGTLKVGDTVILGSVLGKVRAMFDDRGRSVATAGPSTPVEILGLDGLPEVGDRLLVMNDRFKAKQMTEYREAKDRENTLSRSSRGNLETLSAQIAAGETKELLLIVKADMQGSAQVLEETLNKLSTEKVKTRIVHAGVGAITETDVLLASASNALIIGFNVKPERKAVDLAEKEKVEIRLHSIIYELTDEITKAMTGLLAPIFKETVTGRAEVRQTFRIPKGGTIAGSFVRDGRILRDGHVRVLRDGKLLHTGRISSIRRFKDDVNEVKNGMECGINVSGFTEFHAGDVLEAFSVEKTYATSLS